MSLYSPGFPHGLMFHRFHHEKAVSSGQGSITASEFEAILHFVGLENILTPEEWLAKLKAGKLKSKDVCLTFDDGLKSQYEVALPVLEKYGLKAFWFIFSSAFEGKGGKLEIYNAFAAKYFLNRNAFYEQFLNQCSALVLKKLEQAPFKKYAQRMMHSFPFYTVNDLKFRFVRNELPGQFEKIMNQMMEREGVSRTEIARDLWMSNGQLKALSDKGHVIGLHSYDHPAALSKLSRAAQQLQYRKNDSHIQKVCKTRAVSMAHPVNSYHQSTLQILKDLGIVCGFRSNMTAPKGKKVNPNPLELAREDSSNILRELKKQKGSLNAYACCN